MFTRSKALLGAVEQGRSSMQRKPYCAETLLKTVKHDPKRQVFILPVDNRKAKLYYSTRDSVIHLDHTIVPEALNGRGIGKILAKKAFDYISDNNLRMQVNCEFLQHYLVKYGAEYKKFEVAK